MPQTLFGRHQIKIGKQIVGNFKPHINTKPSQQIHVDILFCVENITKEYHHTPSPIH